jgi:ATP-dependent DNA helicase UvrD/PcrA
VCVGSVLELNPEQREAVEHGEGPLLIIAGPGSGKTRVITERIVRLLSNHEMSGGAGPENILALTFTHKAAREMEWRVRDSLPELETYPAISTFHAFCNRILEEQSFDQQLLDTVDLWIFLRRRMRRLALEHYSKLAEPGAFLHDLNEFFSRCQDELVEPDDFEAYVARLRAEVERGPQDAFDREELERKEELAHVFRRSRDLLNEAACTSFGSLISETLRLWDREPQLLARHRERYRFVLVDEFQDSNFAQVELLRRLMAPPFNITAVGDDDQAIYRFRGASHGTFQMFDRAFPGHRTVYLNRNYRSTRKILRSGQNVIIRNEGRYESKPALRTENPEGRQVFLLESPDDRSEASWIGEEISRLVKQGARFAGIAVLYRGHAHRARLVEELRRLEIPFKIRGLSILKTPTIRDLLAYLQLIHSPHHNLSLTRVLLARRWRFPESLARDARLRASQGRTSLDSAIRAMEKTLFASDLRQTGWDDLDRMLGELRAVARFAPMSALLDRLIDALGLRLFASSPECDRLHALRKFVQDWEKKNAAGSLAPPERDPAQPVSALADFMDYFQYFLEAGGQIEVPEQGEGRDAVQLMTVHAAKGLEFPVVFIIGVASMRFPSRDQKQVIEFPDALRKGPPAPPGIHLQEERRLFYVALTRARERLYVSSLVRPGRKPSVFVQDMLSDRVAEARDIERIKIEAVDNPKHSPPEPQPQRALLSETASKPGGQRRLFPAEEPAADLHPNLAEWASMPVGSVESPGKPLALSATAIETYKSCPLRFKFQHLLKIQTQPQAVVTFGATMHEAVRYYFKLRQEGPPRFGLIEEFFRRAWKDTGFEDDYHSEEAKRRGLEQLRAFVDRQNALPAPAGLETERGFSFGVDGIRLMGRIDQIQALGPESAKNATSAAAEVELIDYKTGRPKTQKDADTSFQLSVYAFAAERALRLRPARLTFYNLSTNEAVSTARTDEDLEHVAEEIRQVAKAIREERYEPTPGFVCKRCEFASVCPTQEER